MGFALRERARANASISSGSSTNGEGVVQVPCITLDTFCKKNAVERIAMLKVDVEGYETLVFRGADGAFSDARPSVVYFEVCPALTRSAGFDPTEPAALLAERGYSLHRFAAGGQLERVAPEAAAEIVKMENWVGLDTR